MADCNESMKLYSNPKNIFNIWDKWGRNPQILKASRKYIKEVDLIKKKQKFHFILFDDSLMYGTTTVFGSGKDNYRFHKLIDLNFARINTLDNTKYPLSFQIVSSVKSFTINCGNMIEYNEWYNLLKSEIIQLKRIRIIREYKKLQNQSTILSLDEEILKKAREIIKKQNIWSIDTSSSYCMTENECSTEFGIFKKRIMCRKCGRIYCEKCLYGVEDEQEGDYLICNNCLNESKNNYFDEQENPIINENELINSNLDNGLNNMKENNNFDDTMSLDESPVFITSTNESNKSLNSENSNSSTVMNEEIINEEKEIELKEEEKVDENINKINSKRRISEVIEEMPKEPVSLEINSNEEEYADIDENLIEQGLYDSKKGKVEKLTKALKQSFVLFIPV